MQKAMTCNSGVAAKALSCRNSSPGAILTRRDDSLFVMAGPAVPGMTRFGLLRQILLQLSAASPAAGSAPERRRIHRGYPHGRTDKAAVPRSAKTGGCRQR